MTRILIVEDEPKMASILQRGLERASYAVDVVDTGEDALWMAGEVEYDCLILDVGLPPPDGFEVCARLRASGNWVPILLLTARHAVDDRVKGLDSGADDYLTKPFELKELLARMRSLTRRTPATRPTTLECGDLILDPSRHVVELRGNPITLSAKEFALLELLMNRAGQVVTRNAIMEHVWNFEYDGTSNVIDVYVRYLRRKIDEGSTGSKIETVRGVGYRLMP